MNHCVRVKHDTTVIEQLQIDQLLSVHSQSKISAMQSSIPMNISRFSKPNAKINIPYSLLFFSFANLLDLPQSSIKPCDLEIIIIYVHVATFHKLYYIYLSLYYCILLLLRYILCCNIIIIFYCVKLILSNLFVTIIGLYISSEVKWDFRSND